MATVYMRALLMASVYALPRFAGVFKSQLCNRSCNLAADRVTLEQFS